VSPLIQRPRSVQESWKAWKQNGLGSFLGYRRFSEFPYLCEVPVEVFIVDLTLFQRFCLLSIL
jgi:hypothetical protein